MSRTQKIILAVLALCVAAAAVLLASRSRESVTADFTPPPFEKNALPGEPENVGAGWGTLTLGEELAVSLYSAPAVSGGRAEVCFAAHEDNTAWVMQRVTDEKGNTLGETGLLRPGEYVRYVELSSVPKNGRARVRILCYEPGTYYSLGSADASILLTAPQ